MPTVTPAPVRIERTITPAFLAVYNAVQVWYRRGKQEVIVMRTYTQVVEKHMQLFYDSLSEKDRRRYAAVEAEKLGHGGSQYIAAVLGCCEDTIRQGQEAGRLRHDG